MLNTSVFEFPMGREGTAEQQGLQPRVVDDLPDIPVMPETLLLMELSMHEFSVDLRDMSQLVLSDPGASLQILRLAARECAAGEECPERIEDCISSLGLEACLHAAARRPVASDIRQGAIFETWAHAREIAQIMRTLADAGHGGVRPEEASMIGLFHTLGLLPEMLGWERKEFGGRDWAGVGLKLAQRWLLPPCVADFFMEMQQPQRSMRWAGLMRNAHQMARRSPIGCPMFEAAGPQLCRGA